MDIHGFKINDTESWKDFIGFSITVSGNNLSCGWKPLLEKKEINERQLEEELHKAWNAKVVVIKGGEPTIYPDLAIFLKKMKYKNKKTRITTNGTHPEVLEKLINRKVIDFIELEVLGPLYPETFEKVCAGSSQYIEKVKESLRIVLGFKAYAISVVWSPGLEERDILDLAAQLPECKQFIVKQFVPGNCVDESLNALPKKTKEELIETAKKITLPEKVYVEADEKYYAVK